MSAHSIGTVPDIDAAIMVAIVGDSPLRAGQIVDVISKAAGVQANEAMRPVDRAIQRLRKAGRIRLVTGPGGGWVRA